MLEAAKIIGCGIIYFLVVYLLVIRREARPILPWTVCIAVQSISTVFFYKIVGVVKGFLPEEQYGSLGMVIPSAMLFAVNIAVIFIMFGPVMNKIQNKNTTAVANEEEFRVAPLASVMSRNEPQPAAAGGISPDITIAFIRKMIAEGRKEEALKYLKMLAYCGKDEQSRKEAANMITELKATEN